MTTAFDVRTVPGTTADPAHDGPARSRRRFPKKGNKPKGNRRRNGPKQSMGTARAIQAALWALVGLGAIGGVAALIPDPPPPPPPTPVATDPNDSLSAADASIGGWAELYVSTWLATGERSEAALASFLPDPALRLPDAVPSHYWASRTTTIDVAEVGDGTISVTVAADILTNTDNGYTPAGTRYYQTQVLRTDEGIVALSLPAQIAAPPPLARQATTTGIPRPHSAAGLAAETDTVAGFVSAYLTDNGPLDRFLAPDVTIHPPRPAPFTTAEITAITAADPDDNGRTVTATVRADHNGTAQYLSYSLRLTERDQRWEVAEILPGPGIAQP